MTTKAQRDHALNANDLLAKAKELQEELGIALRTARRRMDAAGMPDDEVAPIQDAGSYLNQLGRVINQAREDAVEWAQPLWHVDFIRTDMTGNGAHVHSWEGPANDEFDALNKGSESAREQGITGYDTTRIQSI